MWFPSFNDLIRGIMSVCPLVKNVFCYKHCLEVQQHFSLKVFQSNELCRCWSCAVLLPAVKHLTISEIYDHTDVV